MKTKFLLIIIIVFIIVFFLSFFSFSAPGSFQEGFTLKIDEGKSLRGLSGDLKEEGLIRSRLAFESFVILYGGERKIRHGYYLFEEKISVYEMARRLARGDRHLPPIRVTIPEGFNAEEMTAVFAEKLPELNKEEFLNEAQKEQGYLFPDTYFLFPLDGTKEAINFMKKNYEKKISPLRSKIEVSGRSEEEIIIMASIIEKEAKGDDDRNRISGILWKRIDIDMPLQADAAPETYQKKGLPERPIANPGMLAIEASINPEPSIYFFYLHDKSGMIHYARDYNEHKRNIAKYLR